MQTTMRRVSILVLGWALAGAARGDGRVRFNRDIRPIMSDTCFHCHGPDKNARKGGLRLDLREEALKPAKSGEIPIVPGKPDESLVIQRIFTEDEDDLMPPAKAHKELSASQKDLFRRWVAEGAVYEAHWAYTPLVKPAPPPVGGTGFKIANPIDAFIAAKLLEKGVKRPSDEADARTLVRRLSLDLIGLPPTPAETEAFVAAAARDPDGVYEALADRLLQSPRFGERWAVWWLDVARFADTVGFHGDQNQRIFPYRDYVIDSFNGNKPFNQFTIEQLAGDLIETGNQEQRTRNLVATGFNRLNMMTREGGAQAKEYLAKYQAERVRTVGGAWLGTTFTCCECHDHKFDPFTMRDFYSLSAYFADVKQWGVYADYGYTPNPELKGWTNDHPFPPEIEVDSPYLKRRAERLRGELREMARRAGHDGNFETWRGASVEFLKVHPSGWFTPRPGVSSAAPTPVKAAGAPKEAKKTAKAAAAAAKTAAAGVTATVLDDGRVRFAGKGADNSTFALQPGPGWVAVLRVELLPDETHNGSILRTRAETGATLKLSASLTRAGAKSAQPLPLARADANLKEGRFSGSSEILGIKDAWRTAARDSREPHVAVCVLERPVKLDAGDTLSFRITDNLAGCVRVSVSPFVAPNALAEVDVPKLRGELAKPAPPSPELLEAYLTGTGWNEAALQAYQGKVDAFLECRGGRAWTQVTVAVKDPLTIRVLPRGNWQDESGEVRHPETPGILPKLPDAAGRNQTRLDLGRWLCSKENPLTPRAVMNRLWKQFFGNGLSLVVDDLGAQGEPPSHPELLDWIAAEFRDSGWDLKHMMKLFVMSHTYRQGSHLRTELRDLDPNNRLLASQNPRRLDAEFVRDNALFIAGLLDPEIGGPSVKPYQPAGYYANLQFPNRDYVADSDDRQWRRGVYMHWQRTFLHPMLANFDAPMRDECTASRPPSNTPQQALTLLNDPTFVEAARVLAARLLREKGDGDDARLDDAFEMALARPAKEAEKRSVAALLKSQRAAFAADTSAADKLIRIGFAPVCDRCNPVELAAWTSVCRVILNLQETITRY